MDDERSITERRFDNLTTLAWIYIDLHAITYVYDNAYYYWFVYTLVFEFSIGTFVCMFIIFNFLLIFLIDNIMHILNK